MGLSARLTRYRQKLRDEGVAAIVAGRLRWYRQRFQMDNWLVGRLVELRGNVVKIDGVRLSLNNPLVKTRHKSTIYFGIYEVEERALAKRYIAPDLPLIEIGGSIGGVACITNKMLIDDQAHVVVECNPFVLPTLEKNRELNGCRFAIETRALAYGADTVTFAVAPDHFMMGALGGRRNGDGAKEVTVGTVTLAELVRGHNFSAFNLISDSEGAEVDMVENEIELLRDYANVMILETHEAVRGAGAVSKMLATLEKAGFQTLHHDKAKGAIALSNRKFGNV